ncbi:Ba148 [Baboon cytomegalovirus]|nr:Ba148 [Baboon cytomegalovirus]
MQQAMKTWVLLVVLFVITRDCVSNNTSTVSSTTNASTSSKATTFTSSSTVSISATSNNTTTKPTTSPATTNLSSASPASSPATTNSTVTTTTPTSSKNTTTGGSTPTNTSTKTSQPTSNNTSAPTNTTNSTAENTTDITATPTENVTTWDSNVTTEYSNETLNATEIPFGVVDLCNATISIIFTDSNEEPDESEEKSSEEQQNFDSIDENTYYPVNPSYSLLSDSDDVMYFYANCERNDTLSNTSCNYTNQSLTSWSLVNSVSFYPAELTNCNKAVAIIEVGNSSLVVSAEATSNLVDGIYKVLGIPDLNSSFLKELAKFQHLIIQGQPKPKK